MELVTQSEQKIFGGIQGVYTHQAESTNCKMELSVYVPEHIEDEKLAVLYYLSGLTCTQDNVTTKAGFQRYASEHKVIIVCPDTSPRGTDFPSEHDAYDFGSGAGFYLNATEEPWSANYNMYDYVVNELTALVENNFPVDSKRAGIFGHSMGGHGALTIGLKNPEKFKSISAFSPIVAPMNCPWGEKAFTGYLGANKQDWENYDASKLIASGHASPNEILIDQGDADNFLTEQLKPEIFQRACEKEKQPLELRMQSGYDHSYFFIASFIGEHIQFHAKNLT
ncbi:MAG: S-formylglutathione hydrolase [Kangiellaceae bacterium]|nr:S-formylglutathione hydrolase [Kangiellaceae bacterium]